MRKTTDESNAAKKGTPLKSAALSPSNSALEDEELEPWVKAKKFNTIGGLFADGVVTLKLCQGLFNEGALWPPDAS